MSKLTIVGASTAGFALANSLREFGYSEDIRLIGAEKEIPYNRTALTKAPLSNELDIGRITLTSDHELEEMNIEFLGDVQATGLDHNSKRVQAQTRSGSKIDFEYDSLVIATGLRSRKLSKPYGPRVFYLRDFQDLDPIQKAASQASTVTVLGSGILGLEVASNLLDAGKKVTVVGKSLASIARVFGERVADQLLRELGDSEINLRFDSVSSMAESESFVDLVLDSGELVSSELLVCAIGSEPNSEWLSGSPLILNKGLVATSRGQAWDSIFAIGDIALWDGDMPSHGFQNQNNAIRQARSLAQSLTGKKRETIYTGYFWSEIFGKKIQAFGQTGNSWIEVLHENEKRWVVLHKKQDELVGLSAFGMPREFARARNQYQIETKYESEKL